MSVIGLVTMAVSVAGAAAVLYLPAARAAAVYLVILLVWPSDVVVNPVGSIRIEPLKFVLPFLLINVLFKEGGLRDFRLNILDAAVIALVLMRLVAATVNIPLQDLLEHQANLLTRGALAYFAIRLAVRTRADLFIVLRASVYAGVFLAVVCIYEALSGFSVYEWAIGMLGGYEWRAPWPARYGFLRAVGSMNNPLAIGLLFSFLAPAALVLHRDPDWPRWKTVVCVPLLGMGVLSTMSSGPLFAALASAGVIAFYPFRRLAPMVAAAAITLGGFWILLGPQLGAASIAEVLSAGAYDADNASYRLGLVEEAVTGGMDDHWLFGYGRVGLGIDDPDSPEFNWQHQDLVNMWIATLVYYGLFGFVPLLLVNVFAFVRLGHCLYAHESPRTDFSVWMLTAAFTGWQVAFLAVAPLLQLGTFYYAMLGLISVLPPVVRDWQEHDIWATDETASTGRRVHVRAPAQPEMA